MRTISLRSLLAVVVAASAISIAAPAAAASPLGASNQASGTAQVAAKHYKNCTALNKAYKHGVGRPGAVDRVSGHTQKVKNFYVNLALYNANRGSDRDGDGIACESL